MSRRAPERAIARGQGRPWLALAIAGAVFVLAGALFVVASLVSPAAAHSSLITSSPTPGQTVGGELQSIDLVFDAGVEDVEATFEAPGGEFLDIEIDQPAKNWLRLKIATPEQEGQYIVRFSFLSEDGDPVESAYAFSYEAAAPEAIAIPESTAVSSTDGDRSPSLGALVNMALAVGVLLLAALLVMRMRQLRAARTVEGDGP